VENRKFADVPVDTVPSVHLDYLSQLLDEDILVRRDLVADSVLGRVEVINFTFDACRDFLLADYLLNIVFKTDPGRFERLTRDLTDEQSTVAEGLQDYLFYASRHLQDAGATAIIKGQPWYDAVFVRCVLDLDGADVTQEETDILRQICLQVGPWAPEIACRLLVNYDVSLSPYANIRVLFDVFDTIGQNDFEMLCHRTFAAGGYRYESGIYPIDKLAADIRPLLLDHRQRDTVARDDLLKLLLYSWNVHEADYRYPAQSLFLEFSREHPRVAKRLMHEHTAKGNKGYPGNVSLLRHGE
jgi:hypothetical protein